MGEDYQRYFNELNSKSRDIGFYYKAHTLLPENIPKKYQKILDKCKTISEQNNNSDVLVLKGKRGFDYIPLEKKKVARFEKNKGLARLVITDESGFLKREDDRFFGVRRAIIPAIFGFITLTGLFFSFSSFTGAVIGITGKSSLTLGVGLFLAGILGLFISRGKF